MIRSRPTTMFSLERCSEDDDGLCMNYDPNYLLEKKPIGMGQD